MQKRMSLAPRPLPSDEARLAGELHLQSMRKAPLGDLSEAPAIAVTKSRARRS
jgi:hypothetical protein